MTFFKEKYKYNPSTDECKLNYKSLHDLAMFIYNYNAAKAYRSLGITKDMLDKERQEKLSLLKENLIKENQKETLGSYRARKLTKDYTVDGQMSLFNN